MLGVLLVSVLLVACGESSQDKAKTEVCDARTEISKQITKLQGLTPSSNAVNEAKGGLKVIGEELKKIKDAQHNLAPARKEQVEPATKAFESELKTIAASVEAIISSGDVESALKAAGQKLKSALGALATSYRHALAPINCS
jgi:Tfp pilus assembly protein PilP